MQNPIGIDFGTNNCRTAYFNGKHAQPELIFNEQKKSQTPAWVTLSTDGDEPIVGERSKPDAYSPTEIPLTQIKNRLGMRDALWLGQDMHAPAEVASWIVQALLRDAEKILPPVDGAVVTVPALANNLQKASTREAVQRAGVTEVRLISEPTAAVIADYRLNRLSDCRILVYSLGAGYFEVAIIERVGRTFKTLSVEGDKGIGGNAFNLKIRDYILAQLFRKHKIDLRTDAALLWRLEDVIEQAKIDLSSKKKTKIYIPNSGHHPTDHLTLEFTRTELEKLLNQSIEQTLLLVQQALDAARLSISDIDHILLVGGSTRIPLVQQKLQARLKKKPILAPLDLIAQGAAWRTASFVNKVEPEPSPFPHPARPARPSFWQTITELYLTTYLKIGHFLLNQFVDAKMEQRSHRWRAEQNEKIVSLLKPLRQKIQTLLAEIHLIEGRQFLNNEEWLKAKQVLEIALSYNPEHKQIRREVWHLYLRDAEKVLKEKDGKALLELIERSQELGLSEKNWPKRYQLGGHTLYAERLAQEGEWRKAMSYFEKVMTLDDSGKEITERIAECYMNVGQEFFENAQWQKAIECFEKILKLYPGAEYIREKAVDCCMNIGQEFFDEEQWLEAIEYFKKALEFYPGSESIKQKIVDCCMQIGEYFLYQYKYSRSRFYFKLAQIYDPQNEELKEFVDYLYIKMEGRQYLRHLNLS